MRYIYLSALITLLSTNAQAVSVRAQVDQIPGYIIGIWTFKFYSPPPNEHLEKRVTMKEGNVPVEVDADYKGFMDGDIIGFEIEGTHDKVEIGDCEGHITLKNKKGQELLAVKLQFKKLSDAYNKWYSCTLLQRYEPTGEFEAAD